jgi:hypothetical protein
MAKSRSINTRFWTDPYVMDLSIKQRYLFLYFLTNTHTNMAGVYELAMRHISFETLLMPDEINEILNKFSNDGKIYYEKGWVMIRNFIKNQSLNPSIRKGIEKDLEALPDWLKKWVEPVVKNNQLTLNILPKDTHSTQPGYSLTDTLSEMKLNEANINKLNKSEKKDSKNFKHQKQKTSVGYSGFISKRKQLGI